MIEDTFSLPGLSPVDGRDIHTRFDGGSVSSDGGMRVLREIECGLKFADILAACLHDKRSRWRNATFETIRRAFLKFAGRVDQLKTRIRVAFPTACSNQKMFVQLMLRSNAQSP